DPTMLHSFPTRRSSDLNIHDPGITTLELLCYALTDLTYRTEYAIPDLLATEEGTVANIKKHFLTAKNIFPNKPITVQDYRKILRSEEHTSELQSRENLV